MSGTDARLAAAHAEVKAEIFRTDNKTGLLLAFVGALLAGVWTVATAIPMNAAAWIVGGAGVALLVAAAGVLLSAVRPNLNGRHGFPRWSQLDADSLTAELADYDAAADIANLSRIAMRKFRSLQRAIDLTRAGALLLIVAAVVAAGGAWL